MAWTEISKPKTTNLNEIMLEESIRKSQNNQDSKDIELIQNSSESFEVVDVSSDEFEYLNYEDLEDSDSDKSEIINENFPQNDSYNDKELYEGTTGISNKEDWDRIEALARRLDGVPAGSLEIKPSSIVNKNVDSIGDLTENNYTVLTDEFHIPNERHKSYYKRYGWNIGTKLPSKYVGQFSRLIIKNMIFSEKIFKEINGIVGIGYKCLILHAISNLTYYKGHMLPRELAIEVLRKVPLINKHDYWNDINETKICKPKVSPKTEKSFLERLARAGVPCPEVIKRTKHILIMSFIGKNRVPAHSLKHIDENKTDITALYKQVVEGMRLMYRGAKFVHGNLSEHKILVHQGKCYFIDMTFGLELNDPNSLYVLMDDCKAICKFFCTKMNKIDVLTPAELFLEVTGFDYCDRLLLEEQRLKLMTSIY